jgi:hypothetical protein
MAMIAVHERPKVSRRARALSGLVTLLAQFVHEPLFELEFVGEAI